MSVVLTTELALKKLLNEAKGIISNFNRLDWAAEAASAERVAKVKSVRLRLDQIFKDMELIILVASSKGVNGTQDLFEELSKWKRISGEIMEYNEKMCAETFSEIELGEQLLVELDGNV